MKAGNRFLFSSPYPQIDGYVAGIIVNRFSVEFSFDIFYFV